MPRTKKSVTIFSIGDKVKHISDSKSEGVVVHRHSTLKDNREWGVHWYKYGVERGVYRTDEIKKYYQNG